MISKNKMCKAAIILLVLVIAFSSTFVGCSSGTSEKGTTSGENTVAAETNTSENTQSTGSTASDKPYEVNMWMFPMSDDSAKETEMYNKMIEGFKADNPGKTVKIQVLPWSNRETKMMTAMAANKGPDVVYMNPDIMRLFVYNGVIMPLDEYISDDIKSDFFPSMLGDCVIEGKTYGIPILTDVMSHIYNLDLLKEIGMDENSLPATFDEYEEMCKKLKAKDIYGTYFEYATTPVNSGLYAQLYCEGNECVTPEGEITIDNETGKKVFERIVRWYQLGYTPKDSATTADGTGAWSSFLAGSVASCHAGESSMFVRDDIKNVKFNWTVGPVLKGSAAAYEVETLGSLSVTKDCKDIETAYKWIECFTSKENMTTFCKNTGYFATRQSVGNLNAGIKGIDTVYTQLSQGKGEVKHACARQMNPLLIQNVQAMAMGSKTVDQGLADIRTAVQKVIDQLKTVRPE